MYGYSQNVKKLVGIISRHVSGKILDLIYQNLQKLKRLQYFKKVTSRLRRKGRQSWTRLLNFIKKIFIGFLSQLSIDECIFWSISWFIFKKIRFIKF